MKAAILTSVNSPFDARLFHKQARTLLGHGYEVVLVAQHPVATTIVSGVRIIGLPKPRSRGLRPMNWPRILRHALREKADIYHFHDPDLLPLGVLLQRLSGKPVIYDAREWYAGKIMLKGWIPTWCRPLVRGVTLHVEPFLARRLAATVTADHGTTEALRRRGVRRLVTLYNYPLADICPPPPPDRYERHHEEPHLLFVGAVGPGRGITVMLDMVACLVHELGCPAHLHIVGRCNAPDMSLRSACTMSRPRCLSIWPRACP